MRNIVGVVTTDGWRDMDDETATPKRNRAIIAAVILTVVFVAAWGAFAFQRSAGASHLPVGPIGSQSCNGAVANAQSQVPAAVSQAQQNVNGIVAQNPDLAPYAAQANQDLQNATARAQQELANAAHQLGC
jgi:hypothetical protein